jgi:hypothetical protein
MMAAALIAAAPAAADSPDSAFDWYGLGGCTVPVIGMPTDFDRVAPFIPDTEEEKVITVGAGDARQAGLLFVFIGCPDNLLDTSTASISREGVTQVLVGVLYQSGRAEDLDKAQFYLLSSAIDWHRFVHAERDLGLPSDYVPDMGLDVVRDPVTGLGAFAANVSGGAAPLAATGQILAPNPARDMAQDAVHFYKSSLGLVRVHHDESWAGGNEALGTITAPAGSPVAGWMGATSAEAVGLYVWIHDTLHVHRYTIVE